MKRHLAVFSPSPSALYMGPCFTWLFFTANNRKGKKSFAGTKTGEKERKRERERIERQPEVDTAYTPLGVHPVRAKAT